jgi:ATP-dependent Lhr-like helicase
MTAPSAAFHALHPRIQRWLWKQEWGELRAIQEEAIPVILGLAKENSDLVIAAATAGGKTEAAFLPILTALAEHPGGSVQTLYVSPLKALINDQFQRLELLCAELEIPVHRWHGDVAASRKRQVLNAPGGILIITPESLEALFITQGTRVRPLFDRLAFVVVDELHAFLGSERGRQLQSLLHRVELAVRRRVPRIALSATLGDMDLACEFLRPGSGTQVKRIVSRESGQEVRIQVRGYRILPPRLTSQQAEEKEATGENVEMEDQLPGDAVQISQHIFDRLRGGHHLIFANARAAVEMHADLLRRACERQGIPNEFWPHHGNLSRDLREEAEAAIKDRARPASAVCTTTLELGIDVGAIESVAQIGPPPSVSSLRQRLGRSGRLGDAAAVLRGYIQEPEVEPKSAPHETLRADLVQTIAAVQLLLAGWYEPPVGGALHLSTLVQQVLSLIAQHGGARADQVWKALCQEGPFRAVDPRIFAAFLRSLGQRELIVQEAGGEVLLGPVGERLVNHYSFYSAFQTTEEYRLTSGGKVLGSLPISQALIPGLQLVFGGRRWVVLAIDEEHKTIDLAPARGGRLPSFTGQSSAPVHDRVRQEMLTIYRSGDLPAFLDATARDLLTEGRENFRRYGLGEKSLVEWGSDTLLFCWRGDRILDTLVVWGQSQELKVNREGLALIFEGMPATALREILAELAAAGPPDALELAATVRNRSTEKFHPFLTDDLLAADYAAGRLDPAGAWEAVRGGPGFQPLRARV